MADTIYAGILLDKGGMVLNVKHPDFGATGNGTTNDSAAIQGALNAVPANGGTVYVPAGVYMIDAVAAPLTPKDNTHLILAKGAVLKAITNGANEYEVIRVLLRKNIRIEGGKIIGDRATHTGTTGEWGHAIMIGASADIVVEDVEVRDCWGDGILVGAQSERGTSTGVGATVSQRCVIRNVRSINNRRQGLSITGAQDLLVEHSEFSQTNGTAPSAGVDFEPDSSLFQNRRITMRECRMLNNAGAAVITDEGGGNTFDVHFENCEFSARVDNHALWWLGNGVSTFTNCRFSGPVVRTWNANFTNCSFTHDGSYTQTNYLLDIVDDGPILFTGCDFNISGDALWMYLAGSMTERTRKRFRDCKFLHSGSVTTNGIDLAVWRNYLSFHECLWLQIGAVTNGTYRLNFDFLDGNAARMTDNWIDPAFSATFGHSGRFTRAYGRSESSGSAKEVQIPILASSVPATTQSATMVELPGRFEIAVDPGQFMGSPVFFLEIVADAENIAGEGTMLTELYNLSTGAAVAGSGHSIIYFEGTALRRRSGAFSLPAGEKRYVLRAQVNGNTRARIYSARLIVRA